MRMLSNFLFDVRHGVRLLRRGPGFAAAAILALGLGIGANAAIFSVVDAVLIRPLPYPDAGRLVMVWEEASFVGFPRNTPAPANWVDWRARNSVFTDIAATRGGSITLTGGGTPESIKGRRVTANFWTVLGVRPLSGRVFTEEEERAGERVAVIGYGLWQRRFGGDPSVVGRDILVNDQKYRVLGVMPRGFAIPSREHEIWTPSGFSPADLARRGSHFLQCIARLRPGVSLEKAQAEMTTIARQLAVQYPRTNERVGAVVVPLRDEIVGETRGALLALLGAAGCVLLIACANVANLLLARLSGRRQELAVRAAMGAGWGRIVTQLLVESLVLAALGSVAGLAMARAGMSVLEKLIPLGLVNAGLTLDWRVLTFSMAVAVLTGLIFGLVPALSLARAELQDALRQGGRGSSGTRRTWLRRSLVVAEVALAHTLLVGAGLLIETLGRLRSVDPGFRVGNLLTLATPLPRPRYAEHTKREAFARDVIASVKAFPGVISAGYTSALPLITRGESSGYALEGVLPRKGDPMDALFRVVTAEYLETVGARIRDGRQFGSEDRADSLPVVIVNEHLAGMYWPNESAVGKRIQINRTGPERPWQTIVGVVRDVRERGIAAAMKPAVYMPLSQSSLHWPEPTNLVVRTQGPPIALANAVRSAIAAVDSSQPVRDVRTMQEVAELEFADRSQSMRLLGIFAALALALAAIGIYGVLAYSVTQRTREIGVRMALGATTGGVTAMILRQGMGLVATGLCFGIAGALAAGRVLSGLLYGVAPADAGVISLVAVGLALVAAAACWIPARRAAAVDPILALREE
jgi:predicted permease